MIRGVEQPKFEAQLSSLVEASSEFSPFAQVKLPPLNRKMFDRAQRMGYEVGDVLTEIPLVVNGIDGGIGLYTTTGPFGLTPLGEVLELAKYDSNIEEYILPLSIRLQFKIEDRSQESVLDRYFIELKMAGQVFYMPCTTGYPGRIVDYIQDESLEGVYSIGLPYDEDKLRSIKARIVDKTTLAANVSKGIFYLEGYPHSDRVATEGHPFSRLETKYSKRETFGWEDILAYFADPLNDPYLTEEDTLLIEEAWHRIYSPSRKKGAPTYYVLEDPDAGETRPITVNDKVRPVVDPVGEGFWYAPYRLTQQELMGNGDIHSTIEGILLVKTPMEAIQDAKRDAAGANRSFARDVLSAQVLLSGKLKFDGQTKPKWIDIHNMTEEQEREFNAAREAIKRRLEGERGYNFRDS